MEFREKIKIKKEISQEDKGKGPLKEERKIVNDVYTLLGTAKISPEELSSSLKDLTTLEKSPKIQRKYYERNIFLNLPDKLHINVKVFRVEKPALAEIKVRKDGKDLFNIPLSDGEAEKIIRSTGILGMVEKKDHFFVLRKRGFEHIKEKHGRGFKKKLRIETDEDLKEWILVSIKKAQKVESQPQRKIYHYQPTEKGHWIKTIVNLRTGFIISSFPQ